MFQVLQQTVDVNLRSRSPHTKRDRESLLAQAVQQVHHVLFGLGFQTLVPTHSRNVQIVVVRQLELHTTTRFRVNHSTRLEEVVRDRDDREHLVGQHFVRQVGTQRIRVLHEH